MDKSFGLLFHLKKENKNYDGQLTVYMRITVDGTYCEISTKRKCSSNHWNATAGRMNVKSDDAKAFNSYLDTLQQKVFESKRKLIETDKELTAENIKNVLLGRNKQSPQMLLEVFKYHNDQIAALVGQEYAPGTLDRYQTSLRHTKSFLEWRYKLEDIDISKLNYEFISEYEFWLLRIN